MKRIYLIAFICLILASCDTTNVPSVSTTEQKVSINLPWKGSLSSAPQNPQAGDMYYNTTQKKSFIYDGTNWQVLAQDGQNGQDGQGGTSNTNSNTSIKDTVYIGESTETIEGITYTVQSYADVYAANPYFYSYYKNYYLNDKLRRIYCFNHNVGSALDYPYTEFQEHVCYSNNSSYVIIYNIDGIPEKAISYTNGILTGHTEYYESGKIKKTNAYTNGIINQSTEYYESGYKKIWNAYTNGIMTLSITYYDLPNSPTFIQITYNNEGKPTNERHLYVDGTEKLFSSFSNENITMIRYYYQSGYIKYYYTNNYFYTFDDNKTGKGNISLSEDVYSTKTAFTEEEALAKLEELRNE